MQREEAQKHHNLGAQMQKDLEAQEEHNLEVQKAKVPEVQGQRHKQKVQNYFKL